MLHSHTWIHRDLPARLLLLLLLQTACTPTPGPGKRARAKGIQQAGVGYVKLARLPTGTLGFTSVHPVLDDHSSATVTKIPQHFAQGSKP